MKRILVVLMTVLMLCALCGCGAKESTDETADENKGNETEVVDEQTSDEEVVTVEDPTEPYLVMTSSFETSVGEAKVELNLGNNGYYKGSADLGNYGNKEFASGTWTKEGDTITLSDANGNEYVSTVEGDNVQIVGTWDVGAMVGTEMTLVVAKADVESYK